MTAADPPVCCQRPPLTRLAARQSSTTEQRTGRFALEHSDGCGIHRQPAFKRDTELCPVSAQCAQRIPVTRHSPSGCAPREQRIDASVELLWALAAGQPSRNGSQPGSRCRVCESVSPSNPLQQLQAGVCSIAEPGHRQVSTARVCGLRSTCSKCLPNRATVRPSWPADDPRHSAGRPRARV